MFWSRALPVGREGRWQPVISGRAAPESGRGAKFSGHLGAGQGPFPGGLWWRLLNVTVTVWGQRASRCGADSWSWPLRATRRLLLPGAIWGRRLLCASARLIWGTRPGSPGRRENQSQAKVPSRVHTCTQKNQHLIPATYPAQGWPVGLTGQVEGHPELSPLAWGCVLASACVCGAAR